jgi:hypothetical protein
MRSVGAFRWLPVVFLLVLGCSHEARRENPFDPTLTPAVQLAVALDDTAGTATLTWTPYAGEAPFAEYQVLRHIAQSTRVDTLACIDAPTTLSYVDASVRQHTAYVYRVASLSTSGYAVTSAERSLLPFSLPAIAISAEFHSATASAALRWTPYVGAGFASYQVWRRSAAEVSRVVFETEDPAVVSHTDSNLFGATEYLYQVVVRTDSGENVVGPEVTGAIHRLVAEWPLDVEEDNAVQDFVRLYADPDGRIAALVANLGIFGRVRTLFYDPATGFDEEQLHFRHIMPTNNAPLPYQIGRAVDTAGQAYISTHDWGLIRVYALDADGSLAMVRSDIAAMDLPQPFGAAEATVLGEVMLYGENSFYLHAQAFAGGQLVLSEDFSGFANGTKLRNGTTLGGWDWWALSWFMSTSDWSGVWMQGYTTHRSDARWRDVRLEAQVNSPDDDLAIEVGGDTYSRFRLDVSPLAQEARLSWAFNPPPDLDLEPRQMSVTEPFFLLPRPPSVLGLKVQDNSIHAWSQQPKAWWVEYAPSTIVVNGALLALEDGLAVSSGAQTFSVNASGEITLTRQLEGWVGEIRSWHVAGERGQRIAVTMPEEGKIKWGQIVAGLGARWSNSLTRDIGPWINNQVGMLGYPLSIAGGPDGRQFVLDAAGSRIIVLDSNGGYITRWGQPGQGDGKFDFGHGFRRQQGLDFAGSIIVDAEGFIYVADVFNRRILKFAP